MGGADVNQVYTIRGIAEFNLLFACKNVAAQHLNAQGIIDHGLCIGFRLNVEGATVWIRIDLQVFKAGCLHTQRVIPAVGHTAKAVAHAQIVYAFAFYGDGFQGVARQQGPVQIPLVSRIVAVGRKGGKAQAYHTRYKLRPSEQAEGNEAVAALIGTQGVGILTRGKQGVAKKRISAAETEGVAQAGICARSELQVAYNNAVAAGSVLQGIPVYAGSLFERVSAENAVAAANAEIQQADVLRPFRLGVHHDAVAAVLSAQGVSENTAAAFVTFAHKCAVAETNGGRQGVDYLRPFAQVDQNQAVAAKAVCKQVLITSGLCDGLLKKAVASAEAKGCIQMGAVPFAQEQMSGGQTVAALQGGKALQIIAGRFHVNPVVQQTVAVADVYIFFSIDHRINGEVQGQNAVAAIPAEITGRIGAGGFPVHRFEQQTVAATEAKAAHAMIDRVYPYAGCVYAVAAVYGTEAAGEQACTFECFAVGYCRIAAAEHKTVVQVVRRMHRNPAYVGTVASKLRCKACAETARGFKGFAMYAQRIALADGK